MKIGSLCGLCSRDRPLDKRLLFVAELTGLICVMKFASQTDSGHSTRLDLDMSGHGGHEQAKRVEMVRRLGNAPGRPVRAPVLQTGSRL